MSTKRSLQQDKTNGKLDYQYLVEWSEKAIDDGWIAEIIRTTLRRFGAYPLGTLIPDENENHRAVYNTQKLLLHYLIDQLCPDDLAAVYETVRWLVITTTESVD